jgi:hypothetical protein
VSKSILFFTLICSFKKTRVRGETNNVGGMPLRAQDQDGLDSKEKFCTGARKDVMKRTRSRVFAMVFSPDPEIYAPATY